MNFLWIFPKKDAKIDSRGFSIGFSQLFPMVFPHSKLHRLHFREKPPGESISQRSFPNWRLEEELLEPGWAV